jgi:PRTRC genetic system protein A
MKIDYNKLCQYSIGMPDNPEKKIRYVLAGNGAIEIRENEIGIFSAVTKKVPGLDMAPEGVKMKLPKIPLSILFQIIAFFKDINLIHGSEAIIQIYWDREKKEYFCFCPKQEVCGSSLEFKRDKEKDKKYLLVADIHSHNIMSTFFSGTDDKDEKEARLFGVIGNIMDQLPDVMFRASSGNSSVEIPLEKIFEIRQEYPDSWLKQVKVKNDNLWENQLGFWEDKKLKNLNSQADKGIEVTKDIEDLRNQILGKFSRDDLEFLATELWFHLENTQDIDIDLPEVKNGNKNTKELLRT